MNKATMIKNYRKMDASESTIIGFNYNHEIYIIEEKHIMPRFLTQERESMKRGGVNNLRLRLHTSDKKYFIKKGAQRIGTDIEIFSLAKNKGHALEIWITENLAHETWTADSIPFYVQGDVRINGKEIQIKFDGATITTERALKNAREILRKN